MEQELTVVKAPGSAAAGCVLQASPSPFTLTSCFGTYQDSSLGGVSIRRAKGVAELSSKSLEERQDLGEWPAPRRKGGWARS